MQFQDPIVSGETLVRNSVRSEDFSDTDLGDLVNSGWGIFADGRAYFNLLKVRGSLVTGTAPDGYIEIPVGGLEAIAFHPNLPNADHIDGPATIEHPVGLNEESFTITSMLRNGVDGGEQVGIIMVPPDWHTGAKGVIELSFDTLLTPGPHHFKITDANIECEAMRSAGILSNAIAATASLVFIPIPGVAVNRIVPASGELRVHLDGGLFNSVATNRTEVGYRVRDTNAAGALLYDGTSAIDTMGRNGTSATYTTCALSRIAGGLTPGVNAYVEMMYRSNAAGTASVQVPNLIVTPEP